MAGRASADVPLTLTRQGGGLAKAKPVACNVVAYRCEFGVALPVDPPKGLAGTLAGTLKSSSALLSAASHHGLRAPWHVDHRFVGACAL